MQGIPPSILHLQRILMIDMRRERRPYRDANTGQRTQLQVTKDGAPNRIINGATDWVYEEEFMVTNLMSWSSDRCEEEERRMQEELAKYDTDYMNEDSDRAQTITINIPKRFIDDYKSENRDVSDSHTDNGESEETGKHEETDAGDDARDRADDDGSDVKKD